MSVKFMHGKKKTRGELRLPQLHFIVSDDWKEKIGNDAFCAWLDFYTWADRAQSQRDTDIIPSSINAVAKRLGISKTTLYNKVIRPLWNYGFIDLVEVKIKNSNLKDNPINIVVYEYPQNNSDLATKPLEKIRDYDTEYKTAKRKEKSNLSKSKSKSPSSKIEPDSSPKNGLEKNTPPSPKNGLAPSPKNGLAPSPKNGLNNVLNNNVLNNNVLSHSERVDKLQVDDMIKAYLNSVEGLTDSQLIVLEKVYKLNLLNNVEYISVLTKVLKNKHIKHFESYLMTAVEDKVNTRTHQTSNTEVRKDTLPPWCEDQQQEDTYTKSDKEVPNSDPNYEKRIKERLKRLEALKKSNQ